MKPINVTFLSVFGANPYKELLMQSLNHRKVFVVDLDARAASVFLAEVLRGGKPDVLHLHSIHHFLQGKPKASALNELYRSVKFIVFAFQLLVLKTLGVKTVWTVHEWADKFEGKWGDIYPSWAAILGWLLDGVITHCESTKREMIKALKLEHQPDKITVVPHANYIGVYNNTITAAEARSKLGIANDRLVFLLFGNIFRSKGFLEAIDAFIQLANPTAFLLIAGRPADSEIAALIQEKAAGQDNVLFVPGTVPDQQVEIYLNAADCVIVPYKVFTTSGVTILAMSFGKACIAPLTGFFSDVLDTDGAFLYPTNCPPQAGLLDAMQRALAHRDKVWQMGQHNLKTVEPWTWDYIAENTRSVYQRCLKSHD